MRNLTHKFRIASWSAWGVGSLGINNNINNINNIYNGIPKMAGLKPIVKRRMPTLSKYIYELSNTQINNQTNSNIPIIFTSKNAELNRTFKIIRSFDGDVSPTQFSMSVHNAIAGLLSVIRKDSSIYTVIDSMSGTLETAFIEAKSLLSENEYVKIIYFDEELPQELAKTYPQHNNPVVLTIVIKKGNEVSLVSKQSDNSSNESIIKLVKFFNKQADCYTSSSKRLTWTWRLHG